MLMGYRSKLSIATTSKSHRHGSLCNHICQGYWEKTQLCCVNHAVKKKELCGCSECMTTLMVY